MEAFSALLALCTGNSPVTGEFPAQRPVTWSFDVFFDLCLNKRLSKQSWGWWSETHSSSLWRHCNALISFAMATSWHENTFLITDLPLTKMPVMLRFYIFFLVIRTRCWTNSRVAHDFRRHKGHVTSLYCFRSDKSSRQSTCTPCYCMPKRFAHNFVVLCFVVVILSVLCGYTIKPVCNDHLSNAIY